jgi:hypothetical protein
MDIDKMFGLPDNRQGGTKRKMRDQPTAGEWSRKVASAGRPRPRSGPVPRNTHTLTLQMS